MNYVETYDVLLMKRLSDGLYFWLRSGHVTSEWGWTNDKSKAYRISPYEKSQLINPRDCEYYFENSDRARNIWCKDSILERFKIVITTEVVPA